MKNTRAPSAPPQRSQRSWPTELLGQRAVRITAAGWILANLAVLALAGTALPFDWPALAGISAAERLVDVNLALLEVFFVIGVAVALTRGRVRPDIAARAPDRAVALRETLALLGYGVLGLGVGFVLPRAFGWHPFGLHLAGTLYGTHQHVEPIEAVAWAGYNLVVYSVVPVLFFRRRYSREQLNLRSADRRRDTS